jgi:hypothetical protein
MPEFEKSKFVEPSNVYIFSSNPLNIKLPLSFFATSALCAELATAAL